MYCYAVKNIKNLLDPAAAGRALILRSLLRGG